MRLRTGGELLLSGAAFEQFNVTFVHPVHELYNGIGGCRATEITRQAASESLQQGIERLLARRQGRTPRGAQSVSFG